jgi:tRNA-Thr(GGU) m(6)t(6)A37 methyltransferase TsaA
VTDGYHVTVVGSIRRCANATFIVIESRYREALAGLEGFSHADILWWFDHLDSPESRATLQVDPPFDAPRLGVFATRSPSRPNPIAISTVRMLRVDLETGTIETSNIDAYDGTPVLDVKPYMPMYSRVHAPRVPEWASGWPTWVPDGGIGVDRPPTG